MAKTTKISKTEWEIRQIVKTRLFPDKGHRRRSEAVLRSALHTLFQSQPELRRKMVIRTYTAGEISIGKAAEMMGSLTRR
ncbi:MAG: hypothetical protein U9R72_13125 [Chloroflexota bacterium]|nr:hypothetical protein [Chloroflexota bacterium]